MTRTDAQGRRLCTAQTKAGADCRAPAITGGTVCRIHGGASPQVREAAHRVVLRDLIGPAMLVFQQMLTDESQPAAVRLRAAVEVFERTGYSDGIPSSAEVSRWADYYLGEWKAGRDDESDDDLGVMPASMEKKK